MAQTQNWNKFYRTGAIAALLAAILFRRNFGAEMSLFTGANAIPLSAADWYSLLESSPLVGLSFLAVFDLVNYLLVGFVFLALGVALWQTSKSLILLAFSSSFLGIAVSFSTNISISMVSLSQQFMQVSTESQKYALLSAGQSLLAGNNPMGGFPNTGTYLSYLLIALAGLVFASLVLPSHRFTGVIGLLAAGCDLAYCLTIPFTPSLQVYLMAFGGAFWMIWHMLIALVLFQYAKVKNSNHPEMLDF